MRIATSRLRQISQSVGWTLAAALIVLFCSFIISLQANAAGYRVFNSNTSSVTGKIVNANGTAITGGVRVDVNADGPCSGPENCGGGADVDLNGNFTVSNGLGNGQYR